MAVDERLTWNASEPVKPGKTEEQAPAPVITGSVRHGIENAVRIAWTMLCFLVFCGFSFFLGWHLKGWHFSAYYEGPNVDVVGAKLSYQNQAPTQPTLQPPTDISQASPEQHQ
jgi:hypothetical protein